MFSKKQKKAGPHKNRRSNYRYKPGQKMGGSKMQSQGRVSECNHNHVNRETSTQVRVVYVEHITRWGELSKANQTVKSNLLPNSDPLIINHFHSKHPEPAHPDRDPVSQINITNILYLPEAVKDSEKCVDGEIYEKRVSHRRKGRL